MNFRVVKAHPFFQCINWSDLEKKRITPPFKPQVVSDIDTRYFDTEFTGESVELTPPDHKGGHLNPINEEEGDEVTFESVRTKLKNILKDGNEFNNVLFAFSFPIKEIQ